MSFKLRDYQEEAIQAFYDARSNPVENRYLLTMATGAGKTVVTSFIMDNEVRMLGGRCLFLVHRDELIRQTVDKLSRVAPDIRIGVVQGKRDEWEGYDVVVASVQTMSRKTRLVKYPRDLFSLVIVDESHRSSARTYREILHHFRTFAADNPTTLLGVTATGTRSDGTSLEEIYQRHIYDIGILELIKRGALVPIKALTIETKTDLSKVRKSMGDFNEKDLSSVLNTINRNNLIAEAIHQHARDRKALVIFCVDINHAEDLAETLRERGINAEAVHGKLPDAERKKRLSDFNTGQLRALTTVQLLVEGWDEPRVDCVVWATKTMSAIKWAQGIGRGTRLSPETGKKVLLVVDCADIAGKHVKSMQSLAQQFGLNAAGKRALDEGKDITEAVEIAEEADRQEEERKKKAVEKKQLAVGRGVTARVIDLFAEGSAPDKLIKSKFVWLQVNENRYFTPLYGAQVHIVRNQYTDEWNVSVLDGRYNQTLFLPGGEFENAFGHAESYLNKRYRYMIGEYEKMRQQKPSARQLESIRDRTNIKNRFDAWLAIALGATVGYFKKRKRVA